MALKFLNDGYFAGKVGIGTESPDYKLDIGGTAASTDNTVRLMQNNGGTAIRVGSGGGGSDVVLLRIDGNSAAGGHEGATDSSNYGFSFKYFGTGGGNNNRFGILSDNQVAATQVEAITILQDGFIGIGTTSPKSLLNVTGTGSSGGILTLENNSISLVTGRNVGQIDFYSNDGSSNGAGVKAKITAIAENSIGSEIGLTFGTSGTGSSTAIEAMRIDSAGNVGIGTTSPDAPLHIVGTANVPLLTLESTGDTILQINRNDDTIGGGNRTGIIQFGAEGSWGTNLATSKIWSYAEETFTSTANGTSLRFFTTELGATTPTEKMIIDTNGNIGIGTTSPDSKLHIKQSVDTIDGGLTLESVDGTQEWSIDANNAGNFRIYKGTTAIARFDSSGNFGIGTTLPTQKLHVAGNLRVTGAYYDSNNSPGTANQVLVSTVTGTDWVDGSGSSIIGGPYLPLVGGTMTGDIQMSANSVKFDQSGTRSWDISPGSGNLNITSGDSAGFVFLSPGISVEDNAFIGGNLTIRNRALINQQENTDVDTGAEVVAQVAYATYTAAFFDFVVKKGTNVRSGTVYACHNGDTTPLVEFTETSTQDLGDTSDVTLSVDISGTNMRLLATVTSDDWSVKSLIRAI